MNERNASELTIMDITERMLNFTLRQEILDAEEVAEYNNGSRDALREMREDMQFMTEKEFISKYEEISLEKGDELFELEPDAPRAQYLDGYCNTIEDVLSFLNPAYIFDRVAELAEGIDLDEIDMDEIFGDDGHHHDCDCGCGHHHH